MEEKDLKQIQEVFRKEFDGSFDRKLPKAFADFWEGNLEPAFDAVHERIDGVEDTMRVIEAKVNKALNIEYVRLEKRVKVVEGKLGIVAPPND